MHRPRIALALGLAAALAGIAAPLFAASAPVPGPRDVVAETVDEVLAILKDSSLAS